MRTATLINYLNSTFEKRTILTLIYLKYIFLIIEFVIKLPGDIPSEIGNLTSLTYLNLMSNELSGEQHYSKITTPSTHVKCAYTIDDDFKGIE